MAVQKAEEAVSEQHRQVGPSALSRLGRKAAEEAGN
jgi:hypothetical protein